MTEPGWFPDPDDPNARRYWDGQSWSAPLPIEAPAEQPAPTKIGWEATAEQRGTAIAPSAPTCAVGPCQLPRTPGSQYCPKHGPRRAMKATPASYGATSALICPHCQTQGRVTSRKVKQKKGVSGAKLTGAVFTAGVSMLGTGLSRKEKVTEMRCGNCRTVWHV